MINAIEWFKEHGFTFDDKITIADVIELQQDAFKYGFQDGRNKGLEEASMEFIKDGNPELFRDRILALRATPPAGLTQKGGDASMPFPPNDGTVPLPPPTSPEQSNKPSRGKHNKSFFEAGKRLGRILTLHASHDLSLQQAALECQSTLDDLENAITLQPLPSDLAKAIEEVKEIENAVKFPALSASNAASIAFHLEVGEDNGAISREALAKFLRELSEQLQALYLAQLGFRKHFPVIESAAKQVQELQRDIAIRDSQYKEAFAAWDKERSELREQLKLARDDSEKWNPDGLHYKRMIGMQSQIEKLEQQSREQAEQLKVSGRELLAHISNEAEQAALIEKLVEVCGEIYFRSKEGHINKERCPICDWVCTSSVDYKEHHNPECKFNNTLQLAHSKGYGKK